MCMVRLVGAVMLAGVVRVVWGGQRMTDYV